jgi:Cu/Zn superoxide dismutase
MKPQPLYALCAALALVGSSAALAQDKPVTVNLSAQNASGENGTATLTAQGDKTQVVIKLTGAPAGTPQPAHIHDGSCAKLDPKPRVPLQNVVDGNSTTTLDMKLSDIMSKGGAINVHKSAADVKTYVACGDMK